MPMPVRDLMRAINRAKIIEIIRTTGLVSRVDLAAESGLSKASVTVQKPKEVKDEKPKDDKAKDKK